MTTHKTIHQKIRVVTIAGLSIVCSITNVSARELVDDAGSWLQVVGEGSLKTIDPSLDKTRVWLEGQARFDNDWKQFYQGMVRGALGYSLSDRATVWLGYTFLPTHNVGKPYVAQQDVWPGFRYVLPTDIGTVSFRTLFEANFLPGNGSDVRFRPRQMIRFSHPFEFEPRLSFVTWDEVFVRLNSTRAGGRAGFDQNRIFGGLSWNFTKDTRAELGYLNQYIDDATHTNTTTHNLIMGSLFVNW
jgi:hypothetical protein